MKYRALTLTAVVTALCAGLTMGTFASWVGADTTRVAPITAGALTLTSDQIMGVDGPLWFDTSVPGSPVAIDPNTFLATAGDQVRMGYYFTLEATGDNLTHQLTVRWDTPPALTEDVEATYTLTENPGTAGSIVHTLRAPLGSPVTLPSALSGDRKFLLDINIDYAETRDDRTQAETALTDIGQVSISAEQVREGDHR